MRSSCQVAALLVVVLTALAGQTLGDDAPAAASAPAVPAAKEPAAPQAAAPDRPTAAHDQWLDSVVKSDEGKKALAEVRQKHYPLIDAAVAESRKEGVTEQEKMDAQKKVDAMVAEYRRAAMLAARDDIRRNLRENMQVSNMPTPAPVPGAADPEGVVPGQPGDAKPPEVKPVEIRKPVARKTVPGLVAEVTAAVEAAQKAVDEGRKEDATASLAKAKAALTEIQTMLSRGPRPVPPKADAPGATPLPPPQLPPRRTPLDVTPM
jgi:hypothetical protein